MKVSKRLSWLVAAGLAGCAAPQDDSSLLGLSVSEAVASSAITLDSSFVIDEPPGVPRGVRGRNSKGERVQLYIERGDVPADLNREWKLSQFNDKQVIAVSREKDGDWITTRGGAR